jgi:hypothetical protein
MKIVIYLGLILLPLSATAQEIKEGREVTYAERTEINFDEMEVTGELIKPQGSVIVDRKRAEFDSLIDLRTNWDKEMKKSLKEIR